MIDDVLLLMKGISFVVPPVTMKIGKFLLILGIVVAVSGCENEPPESIGEVQCSITSDTNFAYDSSLILTRGYVHLNRVEVSGSKNGTPQTASTDFQSPEQFFFIGDDPRQPIKVPIAEATYGNASVQLFFFRDTYDLQLTDTTYNALPDGNGDDTPGDGNNDDDDDDSDDDDQDDDDEEGDDGNNEDSDDEDEDHEGDDGRISKADKTVNLKDFINNAKPSIVLLADCRLNGKNIKMLAALDFNVLPLSPVNDQNSLIVKASSVMRATVTLQTGLLFSSIAKAKLEKAYLIKFGHETVLFIHKNFNEDLHDAIVSNIAQASKLEFQINNEL